MPPTVKSLEERIDGMAADLENLARQQVSTNARLDILSNQISVQQSQLATMIAKLDGAIDQLKMTNARLDKVTDKIDVLTTEHVTVKQKLN